MLKFFDIMDHQYCFFYEKLHFFVKKRIKLMIHRFTFVLKRQQYMYIKPNKVVKQIRMKKMAKNINFSRNVMLWIKLFVYIRLLKTIKKEKETEIEFIIIYYFGIIIFFICPRWENFMMIKILKFLISVFLCINK